MTAWHRRNPLAPYCARQGRKWRLKWKDIPAPRNGLAWTAEDDATLRRWDITVIEMAYILGRTYDAVRSRRQRLGL